MNYWRKDAYTIQESDKLVRLSLYYDIDDKDLSKVIEKSKEFFDKL